MVISEDTVGTRVADDANQGFSGVDTLMQVGRTDWYCVLRYACVVQRNRAGGHYLAEQGLQHTPNRANCPACIVCCMYTMQNQTSYTQNCTTASKQLHVFSSE